MPEQIQISFIVPARNEAEHIAACLDSIAAVVSDRWTYERIVVDHGSSDDTARIAHAHGAVVVSHPGGTVAEARNTGTGRSSGEILAFIDADTILHPGWGDGLADTLALFARQPRTLTGTMPGISDPPSWIERLWFDPAKRIRVNYLPGANTVVPRAFFKELGGFDARLETGEDYDLCRRAEAVGGRVVRNERLAVEHRGWPQTLRQFVRREAWHGAGDFASLRGVRTSRTALATIVFVFLHFVAVVTIPFFPPAAGIAAAGVVGLCLASALAKYHRSRPGEVVQRGLICYAYFVGRSISLFRALHLAPAAAGGHRAHAASTGGEPTRTGPEQPSLPRPTAVGPR